MPSISLRPCRGCPRAAEEPRLSRKKPGQISVRASVVDYNHVPDDAAARRDNLFHRAAIIEDGTTHQIRSSGGYFAACLCSLPRFSARKQQVPHWSGVAQLMQDLETVIHRVRRKNTMTHVFERSGQRFFERLPYRCPEECNK